MRNLYFRIVLLISVSFSLIFSSCKKNPLDNLQIAVNTDVFSSPTAILFENAVENAKNQPSNFKITISGKDKDKVLSVLGNKTFNVENGYIFLNLEKGTLPTPESPIMFKITGTSPGFEPFSQEIKITDAGEQKFNFKMIEIGNLPNGIIEKKSYLGLSIGTFSSQQIIETDTDENTQNKTKLTIPAGTIIKDKNGDEIKSSNVDVRIRYFDPNTQAIDVFPGGLNPQDVLDENGKQIEGGVNFISSGLMQIQMKAGDKIVKNFSKPISAEMELRADQSNPITEEILKEGDSIPLWSRDDETGQWKSEGVAKVVSSNGKLVAKFEMNHLSSWNLDFVYYYGGNPTPLNIVFDAPWEGYSGNFKISMYSGNNYITGSYLGSVKNGTVSILKPTPKLNSVYLVISDYESGKQIKTETFNPTTKGTIRIDVNSCLIKDLITISLKYTIKCTNDMIKPNSGVFLTITDLETNKRKIIRAPSVKSGSVTDRLEMRLKDKGRYKIETIGLDGSVISYESILDISNLTYDKNKLNGFTIDKLEYNPTTKKIEADVSYITSKC